MNRTELAEAVSSKTGLSRREAEAAIEAATGTIVAELRSGNRVSLFGFGTFSASTRAARLARNPQTQATVRVPAHKVAKFAAAAALKDALNKGKAAAPKKSAAAKKAAPAKKAGAKKAPAKKAPAKAVKSARKR